jgi:hypothetical protein
VTLIEADVIGREVGGRSGADHHFDRLLDHMKL